KKRREIQRNNLTPHLSKKNGLGCAPSPSKKIIQREALYCSRKAEGQPLLGLFFLYHDYHHYRRFLSKNGLLEASHAKHKESLSAFLDAYLY
ncbi:MAG TPA: hypothetical protein DD761_12950, partial [Cyanobacteria bacterium UBA11691]|nr:hypothetical protein [Cyanobacteria bacterium UBA11691]